MNDFSSETPKSLEIEKKPLRIIHIEDTEVMIDLIKRVFKKFPADVELVASFFSTEEAEEYLIRLKNANKDLPDMIVSDNNLGAAKRSGVQFSMDLREQGFEIPVVLLTSDTEQFRSLSEKSLNAMGLTKVLDKLNLTESLVGVLKEISLSSNMPQNKPQ